MPSSEAHPLSDKDKERIREEVLYLAAILGEREASLTPSSASARILRFLNSSLGLLIVGTLVGSLLIPHVQRLSEDHKQRAASAQNTLSHFLRYANTPWEEYHLVIPLMVNPALDRTRYESLLSSILSVKLRRYDALASLEALVVQFRNEPKAVDLSALLHEYAVAVNEISDNIGRSLKNLYCANGDCDPDEALEDADVPLSDIEQQIHRLDGSQDAIATLLASLVD